MTVAICTPSCPPPKPTTATCSPAGAGATSSGRAREVLPGAQRTAMSFWGSKTTTVAFTGGSP